MYDTSTSTLPLEWHVEGTGGNCSAFVARSHRAEYYIVAAEGFRPPVAGESCSLGVWDGCNEVVTNHRCRLAAVAAAERYEHTVERQDTSGYDALRLDGAE